MSKPDVSHGYTIISVMIALTVATILMMSLTSAYVGARKSAIFSDNSNIMTSRADVAMQQLQDDIARSGQYGCYNLRTQAQVAPLSFSNHALAGTTGVVDSTFAGLRVFAAGVAPDQTAPSLAVGGTLDAASQILKVQYGDGMAFVTVAGNPITNVALVQPSYVSVDGAGAFATLVGRSAPYRLDVTGSSATSLYVLASCSRLDQVRGQIAANALNVAGFNISTTINPVHDSNSLFLMNAVTRYYFIATVNGISGLYVNQLEPNGPYSGPILLLPKASNLAFTFQVTDPVTRNKSTITTAAMTAANWLNVTAVNFSFNYQSAESVTDTLPSQPLNQTENGTVSLITAVGA